MAAIRKDVDRDGPTIVGLRALILYGLKGTAAYAEHARVLGGFDPSISAEFHALSAFLATDLTDVEALLAMHSRSVRSTCASWNCSMARTRAASVILVSRMCA